jgi:hypothetical protein
VILATSNNHSGASQSVQHESLYGPGEDTADCE